MPADHRLRLENFQCVQYSRSHTIERGKHKAVNVTEPQPLWGFAPQHVEELPPPTVGGSPLISGGHVASSSGDKLEQGAKVSSKSKSWWIKQPYQRQTDPLLRYLWQARNADEHTLQQINQLQPASAKVVEPKQEDAAALERAMEKETRPWVPLGLVEWTPEHVALLPVTNRGVRYDPPKEHVGKPITNSSPAHIGGLALTYLEAMLKEAESL